MRQPHPRCFRREGINWHKLALAIATSFADIRGMTVPDKIALSGVKKLRSGQLALNGVTLSIVAGSFVAIVGRSGSGKTTLLKTINGLVMPDEGWIRLDGMDIRGRPPTELRRRIGYVFQEVGLFPHMTVAENIWLVPGLLGTPNTQRDDRIAELLTLVALSPDLAARYPRALSGGQAQRVGFARALAARPAVMLMDEPFGALDPVTRDELGRAYRTLHDQLGLTSLLVTHDMAEALLLADRVILLDAGQVRADMTPAEMMADTDNSAVRAMIEIPRKQAERLIALQRQA